MGVAATLAATSLCLAPPAVAKFRDYPGRRTLAQARIGDVLKARPMRVKAPLDPRSAVRFMYRSEDATGEPIAVTGVVLVPRGVPPEGGWPIVAWAHGTTGVGPECAPSRRPDLFYDIYAGFLGRLLSDGYMIVATDYEGLGFDDRLHKYLQLDSETRGVIDAVRAARTLVPHASREWFAVGHSEGGHAALGAGQAARLRVPRLDYRGTISIAPVSNMEWALTLMSEERPPYELSGYINMAYVSYIAISMKLSDPRAHYGAFLSPEIAAHIDVAKTLCLEDLALYFALLDPQPPQLLSSTWGDNARIARYISGTDPSQSRSSGPILLVQGHDDTDIPTELTDLLNDRLCELGDTVDYRIYDDADHETVLDAGYPDIAEWMSERLEGSPESQTCP